MIEGEAGIGKSRLVDEMQGQAEALGLHGAARRGRRDGASSLVPRLAGRCSASCCASTPWPTRRCAAPGCWPALRPDPRLLRLAPLLNDVLPLDLPDNALTTPMSGEVRAGNIRDLLLRLVQMRARQMPLLLLIEDAQWLDSASWALTEAVSARVQDDGWPVLLVLATRPLPDPPPPAYSDLQQAPAVEWLPPGRAAAERHADAGLPAAGGGRAARTGDRR